MSDSSLFLVANPGSGTVSSFRLHAGGLERLAVTGGITGCSTFAIDSARNLVYAGVKGSGGGEPAGILTLELNRESGALEPVSRVDLPDGGMNYLALTHEGTGLLGASYGGGYGISGKITDGVVGRPVSRIEFANLHSVLPSADGRFAYFVSLGDDLVAQYVLDGDMQLTPLNPPTVAAPSGSGPRHLVFNSAQDALYVLTEYSGEVLHFARDTNAGTIELAGSARAFDDTKGLTHSRLGADPRVDHLIWGADIHFGANDRHLWSSERSESTLGAVTVDAEGAVSAPAEFVKTEPQPRGFALSPDGDYLVAAGEGSTTVSLYAVEGSHLDLRQQAETGKGANWVRFV